MSEDLGTVGRAETIVTDIPLPDEGFVMASGEALPQLQIAYETYGALSATKDNVVFICQALSGDAHVAGYHKLDDRKTVGWWEAMVGPGKGVDTNHYFVICANIIGGCKGTTGPSSIDPRTSKPYGSTFPHLAVSDIVRGHLLLLEQLGINRLASVIGGSFGGMQLLEWITAHPETTRSAVCIATATSLSAQALAFDAVGRKAITHDPDWNSGDYYGSGLGPDHGLALARKIGHITYLSKEIMARKFGRTKAESTPEIPFHSDFQVESYLDYQGNKFVARFDANSYLQITRAMDEFDLAERWGSVPAAFENIQAKMLVVALNQDWLFPPEQSLEIANALLLAGKRVSYCELDTPQGHDGFLLDSRELRNVMRAFLPWIGPKQPTPKSTADNARQEHEFCVISKMLKQGATVLDLGCGNGNLLSMLEEARGISGIGIDISFENVIHVIDRGHDVFLKDIDSGLPVIPDGSYDYAILSETLQEVHKPRLVLREMLRVAREGIVSFPNFGTWSHRLDLWRTGRMPKGKTLPFEWYETPNIHLFTLRDFVELCREDGIKILDIICVPNGFFSSLLVKTGHCNLGADRVLVRISRCDDLPDLASGHSNLRCRTCHRCQSPKGNAVQKESTR